MRNEFVDLLLRYQHFYYFINKYGIMRIIFVTHGETVENAEGILMGQLIGGTLSTLGKLQAKKIGQKLKNIKIDAVYCSDLSRAIETANEILKYHKALRLNLTKDLRERDFGIHQGKNKRDIKRGQGGWLTDNEFGYEPISDLCSRIQKFLLRIQKRHKEDTVLLVGHRVCGMALECVINKVPRENFYAIEEMGQANMRVFEYPSKG
jgi:broad specificity phosphatase PhoE